MYSNMTTVNNWSSTFFPDRNEQENTGRISTSSVFPICKNALRQRLYPVESYSVFKRKRGISCKAKDFHHFNISIRTHNSITVPHCTPQFSQGIHK